MVSVLVEFEPVRKSFCVVPVQYLSSHASTQSELRVLSTPTVGGFFQAGTIVPGGVSKGHSEPQLIGSAMRYGKWSLVL
jgi:hypothetical protein